MVLRFETEARETVNTFTDLPRANQRKATAVNKTIKGLEGCVKKRGGDGICLGALFESTLQGISIEGDYIADSDIPDDTHSARGYSSGSTFVPQDTNDFNVELALGAGKRPSLFSRVEKTTRNIIKVGALRDDLLIFSEGTSEIISHSGEIITTLVSVHLTVEGRMYPFHTVADNYPVWAEGVISTEIAKKENMGEMATTMGRRHDQSNDISWWTQMEKHGLPSQSRSGKYVSEPRNPQGPHLFRQSTIHVLTAENPK